MFPNMDKQNHQFKKNKQKQTKKDYILEINILKRWNKDACNCRSFYKTQYKK